MSMVIGLARVLLVLVGAGLLLVTVWELTSLERLSLFASIQAAIAVGLIWTGFHEGKARKTKTVPR